MEPAEQLVDQSILSLLFISLILSNVDNGRYHPDGYSRLAEHDYERSVPMLSYCLSLCSINQTCAGMYYDETKSMCYMSGKSWFLNIPGEEHKAFMKAAHDKTFAGLYFSLVSK